MAALEDGVYEIYGPGAFLTLAYGSSKVGADVVLDMNSPRPGQQWQVQGLANGNVTIRNVQGGTYLGYYDKPYVENPLGGYVEAREWELVQFTHPGQVLLLVPGGPFDGKDLTPGPSRLAATGPTPLATLTHVPERTDGYAWAFNRVEVE